MWAFLLAGTSKCSPTEHPHLPIIHTHLTLQGSIQLVPELAQVEEAVIKSFDDIITSAQTVDDISVKVQRGRGGEAGPEEFRYDDLKSPITLSSHSIIHTCLTQVVDVSAERYLSIVDLDDPAAQVRTDRSCSLFQLK